MVWFVRKLCLCLLMVMCSSTVLADTRKSAVPGKLEIASKWVQGSILASIVPLWALLKHHDTYYSFEEALVLGCLGLQLSCMVFYLLAKVRRLTISEPESKARNTQFELEQLEKFVAAHVIFSWLPNRF